jgi:predicted PurR-regulated permease PerM
MNASQTSSGSPVEKGTTGDPSRRLIVSWGIALGLVALVLFLAYKILLLLFAAVLLAVFLSSMSGWLHRHVGISPLLSLIAALFLLSVATGILLFLIAPSVSEQIDRLINILPSVYDRYAGFLDKYDWSKKLFSAPSSPGDFLGSLGGVLAGVSGFFTGMVDIIVSLVLVLVLGFYLAAEKNRYIEGLIVLFPHPARRRVREVLEAVGFTMRGWLLGQMMSMFFLGVFTYVGLSLLDIPIALTLALITAVLTFVPNLGAILSVVPPLLIALPQSPMQALAVLLFYVALQNVEGNFVTPMIMRRAIRMPPAVLISAQLLAAALFGFFGLMLAAPMVAVAIVIVKLLYLEDTLGEKTGAPGYEGSA